MKRQMLSIGDSVQKLRHLYRRLVDELTMNIAGIVSRTCASLSATKSGGLRR